ncbi:ArsR/SmtB family transcription factor [Janibacter limosus]|jgi:DNA-binding transcriptional ArsR family regulator|uniref:ArsR family transcriptional regulator n=1 Tax=Janibacter limosus TaxID=53458 RepID=A0A4P6MX54_9MICO|nr:metalloregulator ArsR/SmtB family transcription factor [Janibacter limosus]QBF46013.1 ArsR family transcriptional regulator [Janibacter limosus]
MHALDVLGDPVRRRILELLADGESSAGEVSDVIRQEFGITQPGVSRHLRVLREHGFAVVRPEGTRRLYSVDPSGPREAHEWLSAFDRFWLPRMAALDTELARGRRARRRSTGTDPTKET